MSMIQPQQAYAPRCISLDLEVDPQSKRILKIGALRPDTGNFRHFKGRFDLAAALKEIDALAADASFVLGHNVVRHDLNLLKAVAPGLALFALPVVDTLALSPLAFPRNPYHHLVKDYRLLKLAVNDPLADAQRVVELFDDQRRALAAEPAELLRAYHYLLVPEGGGSRSGLDRCFVTLTQAPRPQRQEMRAWLADSLADRVCRARLARLLDEDLADVRRHPAIAYLLAWLRVAGENSVMPPWVRVEHPATARLVRELRATPCADPACGYCREAHDARRWLKRWFRYDDFRRDEQGHSLQEDIVASGIAGRAQLGILPTGGGKSLCYQLPALMRHHQSGALTIVISPLQALMKDQVDTLLRRGVSCAAAVNGLLSLPERKQVLDSVRLGDIGILLVSPEQVRNRGFRAAIAHREIAAWVFDEAHCLSKWGHDFRPDYLYVARFIRERHGDDIPPVTCLTATAKQDVIEDIATHFRRKLALELEPHLGSTERENLDFAIVPTREETKYAQVHQLLVDHFGEPGSKRLRPGGAIIYCATQKHTEELAEFLSRSMGWPAAAFHGGMPPDLKKERQQEFIGGALKVIAATNAFGMGIDKPDVRLVIHADIPGSLENYVQEAGRAGRDQAQAFCVLLYAGKDAERQFGLSAKSRLTRRDIEQLLKALRRRKSDAEGNVTVTVGELLASEGLVVDFDLDSRDKDTRVKTALAWLENANLLERNENRSQVFPASLRFRELEDARRRLASADFSHERQRQLLALLREILQAEPNRGLSTDELCVATGLDSREVRKAFDDLEQLGLLANDSRIAAYLRVGVAGASAATLADVVRREAALLALLREAAPDAGPAAGSNADAVHLNLRALAQGLKDAGMADALQEDVGRLLRSLAQDGRELPGGRGSLALKPLDRENHRVAVQREWGEIEALSRARRAAAGVVLQAFLATLPAARRGKDLLASLTLGQINQALRGDLALAAEIRDVPAAAQAALMYLHDQKVLTLSQGLSVFRNAMTLRLIEEDKSRHFEAHDYQPLADHYEQRVSQIHVMIRYAELGQEKVAEALRLVADYFALEWNEFLAKYFRQRKEMLERATTEASWHRIRDGLSPLQAKLVTERRPTNRLVLAGPGSGKTRLVVHRVAFLVRVLREAPHSILVVTFNRHAAQEVRRRLFDLIDSDAYGVVAHTYHGLAMRLTGASFAAHDGDTAIDFDALLADATRLLRGGPDAADMGEGGEDGDALRDSLLAGFRWLLVDEYQDINAAQYDFLSALAGRTLQDRERKLTLLAVGDDDQNIYEFTGAEVEFIRRFEADYGTKTDYLVENFRSTRNIIETANALIAPHPERLKIRHPIVIDGARRRTPGGGEWARRDAAVSEGRVQILPVVWAAADPRQQAWLALQELRRLASLDSAWDWSKVAVIAREWMLLEPLRAACEIAAIPCRFAGRRKKTGFPPWRWREAWRFIAALKARRDALLTVHEVRKLAASLSGNEAQALGPGRVLVDAAIDDAYADAGDFPRPVMALLDDTYEYLADIERGPGTGLVLTTAHGAKGLEFDHVAILDGRWQKSVPAERRLYYVAMTRARQTLTLCHSDQRSAMGFPGELSGLASVFTHRTLAAAALPAGLDRRYELLGSGDVDLDFSGRSRSGTVHRALAALNVGDALILAVEDGRWSFKTSAGQTVGRSAAGYPLPSGRVVAARVACIAIRRREDTDPEWRERLAVDQWEVVLPEVTIEPDIA